METIPVQAHDETLQWENIGTKSRFGRYSSEIERRAILKANTLVTRPATAFEIGCEGGRWSKLLSDFGWRLICTDIDQHALAICKERIPTATCVRVSPDETKFPCNTESIALLLCIQVWPVIPADWFIDEAFRVLQKGGLIVGVVMNRSSWRGLLYHYVTPLRVRGSGQWYWFPFPYTAWRKEFCERGFTMVHEEGFGWPPFRRSSDSPLVPVAARIERYLGLRKLVSISPLIVFIARKDR